MKNLYLKGKVVFLSDAVKSLREGEIESEEDIKDIFQQFIDKRLVDKVPPLSSKNKSLFL